ncbi:hypothetical protein [Rhizobium alvei]|uniref:Uncharacterized protein n=1 Tax=Rhizobium alvei TaxID=1132659 RepID=A0ABT8YH71_9HYPH|nr:hypothetical protein [Rhizobium alvei]MDO6963028.1 hypothetical protein [Rhizobium alvei]
MRKMSSMRVFLVFAVLAATLANPSSVDAGWNPLKDIKRAASSVFRGVGSVLGEGLSAFAGPTINDTANAFQRVADATIKNAEIAGNNLLTRADMLAQERIKQVSAELSVKVAEVDKVVQERIAQIDEVLSTKLGSADIIATRQINNAEVALKSVIQYASIVILLTAALVIVFFFVMKTWRPETPWARVGPNLIAGVSLATVFSTIVFAGSTFLAPPSEDKIEQIRTQLVKSYSDSIQSGDLDSAVFFASQYSSLDATNLAPRFLVQFADLQRDLLKRNALFVADDAGRELFARVSQLARTWDSVSDESLPERLSFLRYEVPATAAMIAWQNARTVNEQQAAACMASAALYEMTSQHKDIGSAVTLASSFVWLSANYVDWMSKSDPTWSGEAPAAACANFQTQAEYANDWLSVSLKSASIFMSKIEDAPPAIYQVVRYNSASTEFYASVSASYSLAAVADAQYRAYADVAQRDAALLVRNEAISKIKEAWGAYTEALQRIPDLSQRDILMSTTGLPLGMVIRAKNMEGVEWAVGQPAVDRRAFGWSDMNACIAQIGEIRPLFIERAFIAVCVNQEATDGSLRQFEQNLQDAFAAGSSIRPKLKDLVASYQTNPEMLSLAGNLPACIINDTTRSGIYSACSSAAKKTRFIDWLVSPDVGGITAPVDADIYRIAMVR